MRIPTRTSLLVAAVAVTVAAIPGQQAHAQANQVTAWAPKPVELTPWVAPNRAHWQLSEILAERAGQQSWAVTVVEDSDFTAQYISMAPGARTPTRFYADNRAWWVVQDGQIRFTIDGQEPFIATKGFLVQVPYRVPFSMETVGNVPSLRFEVTSVGAVPLYPIDETPEPVPGREFVPIRFSGRGAYDEQNRPYLDFWKEIVEGGARGGAFVRDDRHFANIIRGQGTPPPPETSRGHFHLDYGEFWFVLEGQIDYLIEGIPFFSAQQGDVVYAPAGRYHRASWGGDGMATRLAINPFPSGLHHNEAQLPTE